MGHHHLHIIQRVLDLLTVFEGHTLLVYVLVFVAAILESTPVIGTFTPGTMFLLLFGVVAGKGYGSLGLMITLSTIGGVIGDLLSYILGKYGRRFFKEHNRILKLSHIESGEAFFAKYGRRSIIFGRFVGPIRPIVSLIAGAIRMPLGRFLLWNIPGALVWSGLYITLGYAFGSNVALIERVMSRVGAVFSLAVLIAAGIYIYFRKRSKIIKD